LWDDDWQDKPKYLQKTCPSAALSTTNPHALPGRKPGPRRWEVSDLLDCLTYGTFYHGFNHVPQYDCKCFMPYKFLCNVLVTIQDVIANINCCNLRVQGVKPTVCYEQAVVFQVSSTLRFFVQTEKFSEQIFYLVDDSMNCSLNLIYVSSSIDKHCLHSTVVPRYTSLIRSRSLDLYQTGRIPNEFFP
jgi:hypothetical protein